MPIAVHVTHEAVKKFGGIGTVIHGLITSRRYQEAFPQTLLYTPLFHYDSEPSLRLGEDSELIYSGLDGFDSGKWGERFGPIESKYGIHVIYGKKKFHHNSKGLSAFVDIVALDIWNMHAGPVSDFKFKLWEHYGIQSDHYESDRDYEQYLRIGIVLGEVLDALYGTDSSAAILSHEYMGMPAALSAEISKLEGKRRDKTVFYAHEVSTARLIVEKHPGHDLAFYNILHRDMESGVSLEKQFGSHESYSRNELIKRAGCLDYIFAVSDITRDEFLYLVPYADERKIRVVYNGIPIEDVDFEEKIKSRDVIGTYCNRLYGFKPDYIFTHVARLVISKAIWRDIRLLYHLDEHFSKNNLTGFFILLSTLIGDGRPNERAQEMERDYGWPLYHREGWPDLVGQEVDIYRYLKMFNDRSKAIKGVFINQFGFDSSRCGKKLPEDASILSLRLASDLEFGLSIYEPFGIAQLETAPYGGTPVLSSACGCRFLLERTLEKRDYISVDFTSPPARFRDKFRNNEDFLNVTQKLRDQIEIDICKEASPKIIRMLPASDKQRKETFKKMHERCRLFDWDHVVERIIPST